MALEQLPNEGFWDGAKGESQLRLQTIVRLRWLAIFGQLVAIALVWLVLGFDMPVGWCLFFVATSAWLNVYLAVRYPARHRLSIPFASGLLAYDIIQLGALLFMTGGIENPFTMLIVAPVTVSAATLPPFNTVLLGALAAVVAGLLSISTFPLPWYDAEVLDHPPLYNAGVFAAVIASMIFIALYARRLTREGKQMAAALTATELILAREQKLQALDGLAAAAAHELGTPLSTIVLVTKELERGLPADSPLREDVVLLREQALRCREILQKLTKHPTDQDPLHASMSLREMLDEAAAPYMASGKPIYIFTRPSAGTAPQDQTEPIAIRRPGVLYGLGNILENAVDFAGTRVDLTAEWDGSAVVVTIADDGPGFKPEIIDTLGEPYVTSRGSAVRRASGKPGGMGLGFFIAKTLLERSGARVTLENRPEPQTGAIVRLNWPRQVFEADALQGGPGTALPSPQSRPPAVEAYDR